jgi:MATE family multidrug resistance protein
MVPLGLGQAATVRVGLALGRQDEAGIARAGWTAWVIGVTFMGTMALAMWIIPRDLITLFLKDVPANAVVIGLAVSFLRVAAAFQLVDGAQVIGAGMLRGLHDTRWPLVFALVGYWVVGLGIGAWLAFARDWKGVGIWVGLAAGLAAVAALMLARWVMRSRLGLTGASRVAELESVMGGKRSLADPIIAKLANADATKRQPENEQHNIAPPWDAKR